DGGVRQSDAQVSKAPRDASSQASSGVPRPDRLQGLSISSTTPVETEPVPLQTELRSCMGFFSSMSPPRQAPNEAACLGQPWSSRPDPRPRKLSRYTKG